VQWLGGSGAPRLEGGLGMGLAQEVDWVYGVRVGILTVQEWGGESAGLATSVVSRGRNGRWGISEEVGGSGG